MASIINSNLLIDYIARKFNIFENNIDSNNLTEEAISKELTEAIKYLQEKLETTRPSPLEKGQALLYASQQLAICSLADGESYRFYLQTIATLLNEQNIELVINENGSSTLYELALSTKYHDNNRELLKRYLERLDNKEEIIFQPIVNPLNEEQTNDVITTCIRERNTAALTELLPNIKTKENKDRCWRQLVASNQEDLIANVLKIDWLSQDDKNEYLLTEAQAGNYLVVKLLLEKGANIEHQDRYGYTALMEAVIGGHTGTAQLLLEKGANIHSQAQNGYTALMEAAVRGHTATVELLLDKGANIDYQDQFGSTALIWTAFKGATATTRLLLDKGANIEQQDQFRRTALMVAVAQGHIATARLLLEKNANINHQNRDGETALIWTAFRGATATTRLLLEKGANIEQQDQFRRTALMVAVAQGHIATARLLLEQGARVNHQNQDGETALILAAREGHTAAAKLLLEQGADVAISNNAGKTALELAQGDCLKILQEHMENNSLTRPRLR